MRKVWIYAITILFVTASSFAQVGFQDRPITNNLSMPTGYTLNQSEFIIGIGPIGFGITNNIQIGTNLLLFMFQIYNGNIKISFIKTPSMALAGGLSVSRWNLDLLTIGEGTAGLTAITPYVVLSPKIGANTTLHIGGQYSFFSGDYETDDVKADATSEGTRVYLGIDHNLSEKTKFLTEAGYDITFEGFSVGGGFLFGWKAFRLKLGLTYYHPKDYDYWWPNIGLWWRFKA